MNSYSIGIEKARKEQLETIQEEMQSDSEHSLSDDSSGKLYINLNVLDSDKTEEQKQSKKESKQLNELFDLFRSNMKIQQFVNTFKDKMKTHLKSKPKQEVKSFLSNFENFLSQHKSKFWKQAKIDLVEDNYDKFAVFVATEIYNDKLFRCEFFDYIIRRQFCTIDQIRDSIIVTENSNINSEHHEEATFSKADYTKLLKSILEKVVYKLSRPNRPNKLASLQKDIGNQINNLKVNKKTTEIEQEIITQDKDITSKIISILEDLNLIVTNKTIDSSPIEYIDSILDKYNDLKKCQDIQSIIEKSCN